MNKQFLLIWLAAFLLGIGITLIVSSSIHNDMTAKDFIETCNRYYGSGQWNVTKVDGKYTCMGNVIPSKVNISYITINGRQYGR